MILKSEYDLVILGRGAAAFSAAIKASEITAGQASIAMIGFGPLGGTCVNVGCVPSKYLIEAAKVVHNQSHPRYPGIDSIKPAINSGKIMGSLRDAVKEERVNKYENVLKSYGNIDIYEGRARFLDKSTVIVDNNGESKKLNGYNFIIATGSSTKIPHIEGLEDTGYLTSNTVWDLNNLPGKLAILGGGFIGLEIGQSLERLGTEVTVIKEHDTVAPGIEEEIGAKLMEILKSEGLEFRTGNKVMRVFSRNGKKIIETQSGHGKEEVEMDEILVSSGRIANVAGLDLEKAGVEYSSKGIFTDETMKTTNPLIYAAGDVVDQRYKLETLAASEGSIAASNIYAGTGKKVNLQLIPWAVFTEPQFASVGYTESGYNQTGRKSITRTVPLDLVPKARILREEHGIFKMVVDSETEKIVGIHVLSPNAAEFIIEGVYAIRYGLTFRDLIENSHIFPTVAEGIKLTAQSFTRDLSRMSCCME